MAVVDRPKRMPCRAYAATTTPEQSKQPGPVPPQQYQWPAACW
jgi:hypothetical protein